MRTLHDGIIHNTLHFAHIANLLLHESLPCEVAGLPIAIAYMKVKDLETAKDFLGIYLQRRHLTGDKEGDIFLVQEKCTKDVLVKYGQYFELISVA